VQFTALRDDGRNVLQDDASGRRRGRQICKRLRREHFQRVLRRLRILKGTKIKRFISTRYIRGTTITLY
jgi:hypothetical protein